MLQEYWTALRATPLGSDDRLVALVVFTVAHHLAFYGYNIFLLLIQRFRWFEQYKIDRLTRGTKEPSAELVAKAWRDILIGHFLIQPILLYFTYEPLKAGGLYNVGEVLPSAWTVLWQFVFFLLVEDTAFYWSHRLLHHKAIYKYVHKQHHEFKYNIGISSEYDHPVETLVVFACMVAGPMLLKAHVLTMALWVFYRTAEGVNGHTGYMLPFMPFQLLERIQGGADRHEFHHSHNVGSFGSQFTFWDYITGTDVPYRVYRVTSTDEPRRAGLKQFADSFALDLADARDRNLAQNLVDAAKKNAKVYGDTLQHVKLNGAEVSADSLKEALPTAGKLHLTYVARGSVAAK